MINVAWCWQAAACLWVVLAVGALALWLGS